MIISNSLATQPQDKLCQASKNSDARLCGKKSPWRILCLGLRIWFLRMVSLFEDASSILIYYPSDHALFPAWGFASPEPFRCSAENKHWEPQTFYNLKHLKTAFSLWFNNWVTFRVLFKAACQLCCRFWSNRNNIICRIMGFRITDCNFESLFSDPNHCIAPKLSLAVCISLMLLLQMWNVYLTLSIWMLNKLARNLETKVCRVSRT